MNSAATNEEQIRDKTDSGRSKLSKEKIQQILSAVGSRPTEPNTQIEAAEHNWQRPHPFSRLQLQKLDNFTKTVAHVIAKKFKTLFQGDFNVTATSSSQYFAADVLKQTADSENDYYLPFGTQQERPFGFIRIPLQTSFTLVTQLLGETESGKDSNEQLSPLEESLLYELGCVMVQALSDSIGTHNYQPGEAMVRANVPVEFESTKELTQIDFSFEKAQEEKTEKIGEAYVLILCDKLEAVAGKATSQAEKHSAEDISRAILEHLQDMTVTVSAKLASAVFTFEQFMELQVDDILLLDKKIDEPIELTVQDQTILQGRPSRTENHFAVVISGNNKHP